jgi:hypothetical protein
LASSSRPPDTEQKIQVAWTRRGYNPHHPKDPSYYPLLAHLAQTGQILRVKNRPGNVNDSHGATGVIREIVGDLRSRFGRALLIEFRADAAFFQAEILRLLSRLGCLYAIKGAAPRRGMIKAPMLTLVACSMKWYWERFGVTGPDRSI